MALLLTSHDTKTERADLASARTYLGAPEGAVITKKNIVYNTILIDDWLMKKKQKKNA